MSLQSSRELDPIVRRFIEDAGSLAQSFGVGRNVGQIYAFLYFRPDPCTLSDLHEGLGISKGSASMCVRQLEQWGAVRKAWVKGDRRDYYEANDWLGRVIKNVVVDVVGKRMQGMKSLFTEAEAQLAGSSRAEHAFVRGRIAHLKRFHSRAEAVWSTAMVQKLLQ